MAQGTLAGAVELDAPESQSQARTSWIARVHCGHLLVGAMVVAFVGRVAQAFRFPTITYIPDEYIYPTIARSFVTGNGFTIRGESAHFAALLEPIVSAPLWLLDDPFMSFRLTQVMHVLWMSLATVPVYLLARRLGVAAPYALGCGLFTLALPDLAFGALLTADSLGFLLVSLGVLVGVSALSEPSPKKEAAFVVIAGLATFARLQYVVLGAAFVLAAIILDRRRVVRRFPVTSALAALATLVIAAAFVVRGSSSVLGYYKGIADFDVSLRAIVGWLATDSMLLVFATGVALTPLALVYLFSSAVKAPREQRAFALLFLGLLGGVLLEAAVWATNGSPRFQERYLFAPLPWIAVAFCLGLKSDKRLRLVGLVIAFAFALAVMFLPLTGYTAGGGSQDSPFLKAQVRLEQIVGDANSASLLVALASTLLVFVGAAVAWRPRLAGPVIGLVVALGVAGSVAASDGLLSSSKKGAVTFLKSDPRWIDHAGVGKTSVLVLPQTRRALVFASLLWNRSIDDAVLLDAAPFDLFPVHRATVGSDGVLRVGGKGLTKPILTADYGGQIQFSNARVVARSASSSLWKPSGGPLRVTSLTDGRYFDGWLSSKGSFTVWPEDGKNEGVLRFRLSFPIREDRTLPIMLTAPGYTRHIVLARGSKVDVAVPFKARGPWKLEFRAEKFTYLANARATSGLMKNPPRVIRQGSPPNGR